MMVELPIRDELPQEVVNKINGKDLNKVILKLIYKNYKNDVSERKIIPLEIFFGANEFHKDEQWLIRVWDIDKNDYRTYAFKDIQKIL